MLLNIEIFFQPSIHENEMKKQHIPFGLFLLLIQLLKVQKIIKNIEKIFIFWGVLDQIKLPVLIR